MKPEESAICTMHFKDFKDWLQLASAFQENKNMRVPIYDAHKTPELWSLSSSFAIANTF